jgi:hypothetical protein
MKLFPVLIAACLAASSAAADSVYTVPGPLKLIPLDVAIVTTGGTAVIALAAAHRNKGGWLFNPNAATVNLCIDEIDSASGTTSAGNTTCIVPGQTYRLAASPNAVSVVSSDSAHAFSGYGWN